MTYKVIDKSERFVNRQPDEDVFRVLSLGAGLESTTLLLMAANGELCTGLDCAIFADTGAEMQHTYDTLEWLIPEAESMGVDVHIVTAGNWEPLSPENTGIWTETLQIAQDEEARRGDHQPFYVADPNGDGYSMTMRKCTRHYKIRPVSRKIRELMDANGYEHVERWQGVSMQEVDRINAPGNLYTTHRFPLVTETPMRRTDCNKWLRQHSYPKIQKSACKQCPYRKKMGFAALKRKHPEVFEEVAAWEESIRASGGLPGMDGTPYMTPDLIPLRTIQPIGHDQAELFNEALDLGGCSAGSCGL